MTKEEKLKCFEWLLDAAEAYKLLMNGVKWGDDEYSEVHYIGFTGGVHLTSWDNGEKSREFAKELGITYFDERPLQYEGDSVEVSFMFNDVKFFWLEEKEKHDA